MFKYIFYNLYSSETYSIIDESVFNTVLKEEVVSYSPSFLRGDIIWKEALMNGTGTGIIDMDIFNEEINNPKHNNYKHFQTSGKLLFIEKDILKMKTNATDVSFLLGGKNDINSVLLAYQQGAILAANDYDELANAVFMGVSLISKIPKEIINTQKYKEKFIEEINRRIKIIKSKI